ncbi:histone methylation protein DOT1-domain-containing protein [Amylocystis lapponica]|nr:histone methylation protein DOT1-domain-containing protein [Amylocystis lapponica]
MAVPPAARPSTSDLSFFSPSRPPKPGASAPAPALVTTRLVTLHHPSGGALKVTARSATPGSSSSTPAPDPLPKRKAADLDVLLRNPKRQRLSSPAASARSRSEAASRASSSTPSSRPLGPTRPISLTRRSFATHEEPGDRSRSGSAVPTPAPSLPRECWTEEDGRPGPGFLSSESVVRDLMKTYKAYFKNPDDVSDLSWSPHPTDYPVVELEYPNTGAQERFILLTPKDPEHYNPIMCLRNTLHTIMQCYLTPAQRALFGTLPSASFVEDDDTLLRPHTLASSIIAHADSPLQYSVDEPPPASPSPSASSSTSSSASIFSAVSTTSSVSSISSLSSISVLSSYASTSPAGPSPVNYLRLFERALNTHNGPLFMKVMDAINTLLRCLKYPPVPADPFEPTPQNNFRETVRSWGSIPPEVIVRIVEETNQRAVGPNASQLNIYQPFSSRVYGELWPPLISQIIADTGLGADSLFVDLGSGVGNVVLQASLETGCRSFGVEVQPTPARIARSHVEQFRMRCRMWGVAIGDVELEEGDMLESARVDELVSKADVVLVNNKVFDETLNERLRPKFLDLKEGAYVVSLKPFVSSARLTERNLDDISSIFQVSEGKYNPGSVSWTDAGGAYFLHRVDREGYADSKQRLESRSASSRASSRSTRSRSRR